MFVSGKAFQTGVCAFVTGRGLSKVSDEEVMELYGSTVLPINYIEPPPGRPVSPAVLLCR